MPVSPTGVPAPNLDPYIMRAKKDIAQQSTNLRQYKVPLAEVLAIVRKAYTDRK